MNTLLLKRELIKTWESSRIDKVYKYKHRIKTLRTGVTLLYDLKNVFNEIKDIAEDPEMGPRDGAVNVAHLMKANLMEIKDISGNLFYKGENK